MANPLYDALLGQHAENNNVFLQLTDGTNLSYADFISRCGRFASVLDNFSLGPGDRVAIQVEKCVDALALCNACIQRGLVFLPLNPAYTAAEVDYFVTDSGAKLFICAPERVSDFSTLSQIQIETLGANATGTLAALAAQVKASTEVIDRDENDLAALLYTSGTTGRSKGAMLSQKNLLSNAQILVDYWQFSSDDTLIHALPIFHTHGLFVATNTALLTGASMIFMPQFNVKSVIEAMPNATAMMGVPTFYTRLLADTAFRTETTKNMRLFISGSAPLLAETHVAFTDRTGHRILERYGMTETNMNTSNPYDGERKTGTVGTALPNVDVRIVDQTSGEPVTPGEIGILEVRGPNVFQGYWNMPEKTAADFRTDGYFITGDLAQMDPDGYITIVGRSKDLIISGGFNIYPKEVEEILDDQPGVLETAVIGIPHPDMGEAVVGVIVAQAGHEFDTDQFMTGVSKSLARFKQPRHIVQVDALPRNTMGKVQKAELRKTYAGVFAVSPMS